MEKLNLNFSPSQVLKAATLNVITGKIDELVTEANKNPATQAAIALNSERIDNIINSEVDISQAEFDALQESGKLDPSKAYYIYE